MAGMGDSEAEVLAWCVVANVAAHTTHGPDGVEVRRGLKHFAPGAKLWVLPPQWGDGGEKLFVVGHHRGRGTGRLARLVIDRYHLTNFRVRGIYSPAVYRELMRRWEPWGDHPLRLWETRDVAEETAQWWNRVSAGATEVDKPRKRVELLERLCFLARGDSWAWQFLVDRDLADALRDDREAAAVTPLVALVESMVADLGTDYPYDRFVRDPRWTDVIDAATKALEVLTA